MKQFLFAVILVVESSFASAFFLPMDHSQKEHLRAYGVVYRSLARGDKAEILLNYRGGSFLISATPENQAELIQKGIVFERVDNSFRGLIEKEMDGKNQSILTLENAPAIAVYQPGGTDPWDDAVVLVLEYAEIPFERVYDPAILKGELSRYDWLHLHHEDFTGQFGKFYGFADQLQWYQQRRLMLESVAAEQGFQRVADLKLAVVQKIRSFTEEGGFLFAMCSATDTIDIALAAASTDIVPSEIDHTPVDPSFASRLNFSHTFAFENFEVYTDPHLYEFSSIDVNPRAEGLLQSDDYFQLFTFHAKTDPVLSLLTQNHVKEISGFLGQTTAFHRKYIKSGIIVLAETPGTDRVRYLAGSLGKGFFSFYSGHDPEDYQHLVGDSPVNMAEHASSPGYRLILNNIFLPSVKKKEKKT